MWLHEVQIRNFRKIDALTVSFSRGLTVLVGENNSGKTTVIDALRLMLFSSRDFDSLRLTEDDFRAGTEHARSRLTADSPDLRMRTKSTFKSASSISVMASSRCRSMPVLNSTRRQIGATSRCGVARRKAAHFRRTTTTASRRSTCSRCAIRNAACALARIPKYPALSTA